MENYSPAPDKVTLFGLSYCPYSKGARIYLARRGVDFIYIEVDGLRGREMQAVDAFLAALTPSGALPVTVIGGAGQASVGYSPKKLQALLPLMPLKKEEKKIPVISRAPATILRAARGAVEKGRHPAALLKAAKGAMFKPQTIEKREFVAKDPKPDEES